MFKDFLVLSALAKGGGASIEDADWDIFKKTGLVPLITDRVASFSAINAMIDPLGIEYKAGEKYLVKWEGVDYKTTCFARPINDYDVPATMYYLGNPALNLDTEHMGDTGEPFIFQILTSQGQEFQAMVTKSDGGARDIYFSISVYEEVKNPIPQKYLPEGYPSGLGDTSVVEILSETQLTIENSDEGLFFMPQMNLVEGNTYIVKWDGVEYKRTAVVVDIEGMAVAGIGNGGALGFPGLEDTGEPFGIVDFGMDIASGAGIYGYAMSVTGASSATVSISMIGGGITKMANEYLDLEWLPVTKTIKGAELVAEHQSSINGLMNSPDYTVFSPENDLWIVTIDGVEYERQATVLENTLSENNRNSHLTMMCGNPSLIGTGADYGDTFLAYISYFPNSTSESMANVVFADGTTGHTVSIHIAENSPNKIPEKFMPESVEGVVVRSSTPNSTKLFKVTVDDSGTITATEV